MRKLGIDKFKFFAFFLGVVSALPVSSFAQTPDEIEAKMDQVKMSDEYIYGEGSADDANLAYDNALSDLTMTVNEIRGSMGPDMLKTTDLQTVCQEMRYAKGQRYVVFLYLPLSLATTMKAKSPSESATKPTFSIESQKSSAQKPYALPSDNQSSISQQQNLHKPSIQKTEKVPIAQQPADNEVVEALLGQDTWTEIKGILTEYKKTGKIKETGLCTNPQDTPGDAVAILIDEMYGILSILSPLNDSSRINYRTLLPDSETNYSNCKVIVWYR